MRVLYSLLLYLLLPLVLLRLLYRSIKNKGYRQRMGERFGLLSTEPARNGVWVHAVSVGESIAAVKLIKGIQTEYPNLPITVTCGTPTGSKIIQTQLAGRVFHTYLPYDLPGSVKRFFAKVQPKVGIIMETELWPNLLHFARIKGIHLLISNLRLSDHSFKRYQIMASLTRQALDNIDYFAAQTKEDATRVISLGADKARVSVVGNLKFELETVEPSSVPDQLKDRQTWLGERPIWLAGSTHAGEDQIVLGVHAALLADHPDLLLIIVPRHPERFDDVDQLSSGRFNTLRRSELNLAEPLSAETQVLVVDSMGELNQFIAISDWCFVGGSLVPVGGHNVLEACHAGVPVIFGQHMDNFRQIARLVKQAGAGLQVHDEKSLFAVCNKLAGDAAMRRTIGIKGKEVVATNQGALSKTMALLKPWLITT